MSLIAQLLDVQTVNINFSNGRKSCVLIMELILAWHTARANHRLSCSTSQQNGKMKMQGSVGSKRLLLLFIAFVLNTTFDVNEHMMCNITNTVGTSNVYNATIVTRQFNLMRPT